MAIKKKRKYKNKAEQARKYHLPNLLKRFNYQCHWCKDSIVLRRSIVASTIIVEKHGIVVFFDNGSPKEVKLASVDHLKTLASGGTNEKKNLVPSCWFCNNDRSNKKLVTKNE
jgi:hypothetical protein